MKPEKRIAKVRPATEEEIAWIEYFRQEQFRRPERLEDAAKALSTMVGIVVSVFAAVIGSSRQDPITIPIKVALFLALLSMIASFITLFPKAYKTRSDSAQLIQIALEKAVRNKRISLLISLLLFGASISILLADLII